MKKRIETITLLIVLFMTLTGTLYSDSTGLKEEYKKAVEDAANAEPDEISRELIAITAFNPELKWNGAGEDRRLLVVTWTSWNGYDDYVGKSMTLSRKIWVTTVPELKKFSVPFADVSTDSLSMRIKQLLGLPPDDMKTKFVEMWVKPEDLFRPSADPDIADHEAEIDFPDSKYMTVTQEYKTWFNHQKTASYGENGYPWTRLGYTYDWAGNGTEIGLSEFVIDENSEVIINGIWKTGEYTRP